MPKKKEISKSQPIRLMDVFLLGPFMIWFGIVATEIEFMFRVGMVASGALTIIYNGLNYLINKGYIKK